METRKRPSDWLYRLPRPAYWVAGAAVAFTGAIGARMIAQEASPPEQVVIWLSGGVVIFIGLAILSMGTRARLEGELPSSEKDGQADRGDHRSDEL